MSECDCGIGFKHRLQCGKGKPLVHLEDHEAAMNELQAKYDALETEAKQLRARERADQAAEQETMNHLRVAQSQHQVQLTLRGKSKMFTPKAIKDLISKLQVMAENAESYEPSAMIHCRHGEKAPVINFGSNPLLREF